ncbi:non-ribosomal peptide synthetase, partial [Actinomadura syzygii]
MLPLSPLQRGMLFHSLYDEGGLDVYAVQVTVELRGPVNGDRLRAAAGGLLRRHPNLRAGFWHEGVPEPVQFVPTELGLPVADLDLAGLPAQERAEALETATRTALAERFVLHRPPLLRLLLVRLGPADHRLVVTAHHILVDGWSMPLLVRDLLDLYDHCGDTSALPAVRPYRDHLAWLARQDTDAARRAWAEALAGLDAPTLLTVPDPGRAPVRPGVRETMLPEGMTAALTALARRCGITPSTLVQCAWAMLLGVLTGRDDVVFGLTVAGRPAEVPGSESMVGLFINTVPVRVALRPAEPFDRLLRRVAAEQARLLDHHHLGLDDVQRQAGLGDLFDTLVVIENYPVDPSARAPLAGGATVGEIGARDATHYPLTLAVGLGKRIVLQTEYRPDVIDARHAESITRRLVRLLEQVAVASAVPVGRFDLLDDDERARLRTEGTGPSRPVRAGTVADRFAERAAVSPGATAVVCGQASLTFAQVSG